MLKVGIQFGFLDESWLGGVSAILNLVTAVQSYEHRRIEPVLVASRRTPAALLRAVEGVMTLRTDLIDGSRWGNWLGRTARRMVGRNLLLEQWLKSSGIDVYSHGSPLGRGAKMPTIGHIADFGYRYFPELYAPQVFARIESGMSRVFEEYDYLILSSRSAEKDYHQFFPNASAQSVVLNILPAKIPEPTSTRQQLLEKYRLPRSYIYSPNQFWVHKNHIAIINALAIAKSRGHDLHVVCTGQCRDSRKPDHFRTVMEHARALGMAERFHVLGVVPYEDTIDLMRHSVAVLSASLFEGWGISVTEAKLLGKLIVLSDIPAFREQAPDRAFYFDPRDADELAQQLVTAVRSHSEEAEQRAAALQQELFPAMVAQYARDYENVVLAAATRADQVRSEIARR